MRTLQRLTLFLLVIGLFASPVAKATGPISLLSFQVNYLGAFQSSGGNSHTGQISWTPIFDLGVVGLRGEFGAALLKNAIADSFLSFNYEAFLRIGLLPNLKLELGGGAQTWEKNGGTKGILSSYLCFGLLGSAIDRVFVGYSRYFLGNGVNEVKVGLGLVF